jgi:flavodoxin I
MKIVIIYATQMGTTQLVADTAKNAIVGHEVEVLHANSVNLDTIHNADAVIFAIPTYDDGLPEASVRPLLESLHQEEVTKPYAIIAPGDSSYPNFTGAAEVIKAAADKAKMREVIPALRIDGYMYNMTAANQNIETWAQDFVSKLG